MILEEGAGEENGTFASAGLLLGQNGDGRAGCPESLPARLRPGTRIRFPILGPSMKRFVAATVLVSPFFAGAQEPSADSRTCGHRKTPTRTRCA